VTLRVSFEFVCSDIYYAPFVYVTWGNVAGLDQLPQRLGCAFVNLVIVRATHYCAPPPAAAHPAMKATPSTNSHPSAVCTISHARDLRLMRCFRIASM